MPRISSPSDSSDSSESDPDKVEQDSDSDTTEYEDEDEEEEEEDPRIQCLNSTFKPKPVMSEVSPFVKKTLRSPFLGLSVGKDERKDLRERYYCSPSDFKLFSAPLIFGELYILII